MVLIIGREREILFKLFVFLDSMKVLILIIKTLILYVNDRGIKLFFLLQYLTHLA